MSLDFPDWWEGGFPDREMVVRDILQPLLNLVTVRDIHGTIVMDGPVLRRPQVVTALPDKYTVGGPLVRLYRGGGAADVGALQDPASVQVAIICDTRDESWKLMELCRQWLLSFVDGGTVYRADGSETVVDQITEFAGPQLTPEKNPDKRLVPLTFRVVCRKPRGTPDYRKIREQLRLSAA